MQNTKSVLCLTQYQAIYEYIYKQPQNIEFLAIVGTCTKAHPFHAFHQQMDKASSLWTDVQFSLAFNKDQ